MDQKYYFRRQIVELLGCDEGLMDELESEELIDSVELESERESVFPEDQVERIRIINNLVRDLDVNFAGCGVILEMRENIIRMQRHFDRILETLLEELKRKGL